jgi:hypothetical protein
MVAETDIREALINAFRDGAHRRGPTLDDLDLGQKFSDLISQYSSLWGKLQAPVTEKVTLMGRFAAALAENEKRDMTIDDVRTAVRLVCIYQPTWICRLMLNIVGDFPRQPDVEWPRT